VVVEVVALMVVEVAVVVEVDNHVLLHHSLLELMVHQVEADLEVQQVTQVVTVLLHQLDLKVDPLALMAVVMEVVVAVVAVEVVAEDY
jgi:hypothetical protein